MATRAQKVNSSVRSGIKGVLDEISLLPELNLFFGL
jgi:hypothetical protein